MKKVVLAFSFVFALSLSTNANPMSHSPKTLVIDLDNVSKEAVQTIKSEENSKIKSEIDLTHIVTFVKSWRKKDIRNKELLHIYSSVIPQAFKKYPKSKEFQFSTYINYKNKTLNKKETKKLSNIIVTREDINKIDWNLVNIDNINSNKYIKKADFSDL